jgi:hypothetical protein
MKNIINCSLCLIVLLGISCSKKTNEEMIIGEWKLLKVELQDKSIATQKEINRINDEQKIISQIDGRFRFDADKKYRMYHSGKESNSNNIMEYKIVDKTFELSPNGNIIDFDLYKRDGSLSRSTNKPGPFEIIKITKNELVLKNLGLRYKIIRQGENMTINLKKKVDQEENVLYLYQRIVE